MTGRGKGKAQIWFEEAMLLETDECILWPFYCEPRSGHGKIGVFGRSPQIVSRLACERAHGPCPPGMHALHSRMPGGHPPHCINPRHMRWGTPLENVQDRDADKLSASRRKVL